MTATTEWSGTDGRRPVFVLDVTDFRPMVSSRAKEFLDWITRHTRAERASVDPGATAASRLQGGASSGSGISLVGAWYAVGVTGHDKFREFSLYECHGGWDGGWRTMLELYKGVPDSLFLSDIDGVRFRATTVPLAAAPGCPHGEQLVSGDLAGDFALLELADVRPGSTLDYLAAVREHRVPLMEKYGARLTGLYEVAFTSDRVCTLWSWDIEGYVRMQRARDGARGLDAPEVADQAVLAWDQRRASFVVGDHSERLLAGYPGPALSPG